MFVNEENIIYVMIGCTLFTSIGIILLLMVFGEIKKADQERQKALIERVTQENLARTSNAFRKGHRR